MTLKEYEVQMRTKCGHSLFKLGPARSRERAEQGAAQALWHQCHHVRG